MHVVAERGVEPPLAWRVDGRQLAHEIRQQGPQSRHLSHQGLQLGEEAGEGQLDLSLADSCLRGDLEAEDKQVGEEPGCHLAGKQRWSCGAMDWGSLGIQVYNLGFRV